MKNLFLVVGLMFALGCNWAVAQGDSVSFPSGRIKVVRPDVKPVILVKVSYSVFTNKRGLRHWKAGENPVDILVKSDLDARQTTSFQYPKPVMNNTNSIGDFNWQDFFESGIDVNYKYKETPALDTIMIRVVVKKNGKFDYSLIKVVTKNNELPGKCFNLVQGLVEWKPGYVMKNFWNKKNTKMKRAYCGILLSVIVSANPFSESMTKGK